MVARNVDQKNLFVDVKNSPSNQPFALNPNVRGEFSNVDRARSILIKIVPTGTNAVGGPSVKDERNVCRIPNDCRNAQVLLGRQTY